MLKHEVAFDLSVETKELFNFLVGEVIGPWMLFRISMRNGDTNTMMMMYYTHYLKLAIISNCYNYTHMVCNEWVDTMNLEKMAETDGKGREIQSHKALAYSMKVRDYSRFFILDRY